MLVANKCDLVDENWKKYKGLLVFGFCGRLNVEIMDVMRLCLEYHGYQMYF